MEKIKIKSKKEVKKIDIKSKINSVTMAKAITISGLTILLGWAVYVFSDFSITLLSSIHFEISSGLSEIFKHIAIITIGLILTFAGYSKLRDCE